MKTNARARLLHRIAQGQLAEIALKVGFEQLCAAAACYVYAGRVDLSNDILNTVSALRARIEEKP